MPKISTRSVTAMIKEITAKSILTAVNKPDDWFGIRHIFHVYRGCPHGCIYCDCRSQTGQSDLFDEDIEVKTNAEALLADELSKKRTREIIGTGCPGSDPYQPAEEYCLMTQKAASTVLRLGYMLNVCTKSDMILRDLPLFLQYIPQISVTFVLSTCDDVLASKLEPLASPPSMRLAAMDELSKAGILTGILISPVMPFIEDSGDNISTVISSAASFGAQYAAAFFGVKLRDRQREYCFKRMETHFPGMAGKYSEIFGGSLTCLSPRAKHLDELSASLCERLGLAYGPNAAYEKISRTEQISFFDI